MGEIFYCIFLFKIHSKNSEQFAYIPQKMGTVW